MFYIDGWPILSLMIKTFCDHFVSLKICVILYLPNPLPSYISYWRKKIINKEKTIHLHNSQSFSWNSKLNLSSPVTSQCIVQLQMDLSMWKLFIINYLKDANGMRVQSWCPGVARARARARVVTMNLVTYNWWLAAAEVTAQVGRL